MCIPILKPKNKSYSESSWAKEYLSNQFRHPHWWGDLFMCDTVHIRSYNVKSHGKVQGRNSTPECNTSENHHQPTTYGYKGMKRCCDFTSYLHLRRRWSIIRLGRDVLVRKLFMKTLKIIRLMHALKAKLVHKWVVYLVCHDLVQYMWPSLVPQPTKFQKIHRVSVRREDCMTRISE